MAILRVVAIAFVLNIIMFQSCWSETAYDRQGDVIPPGARFRVGMLDRVDIEQDRVQTVIINDTLFRVDEHTTVRTTNGGSTSLDQFKPGTLIEFYSLAGLLTKVMPALNEEGNSNETDSVDTLPVPATESTPLHKEGGVWKN